MMSIPRGVVMIITKILVIYNIVVVIHPVRGIDDWDLEAIPANLPNIAKNSTSYYNKRIPRNIWIAVRER